MFSSTGVMPAFEIINSRRWRVGWGSTTIYNNRVDLDDNFEVIYSHETAVSAAGHIYEALVLTQMGLTTWVHGDSWGPAENHELALDPSGEWFEEELTGEVYDSRIFQQAATTGPPKKPICKRSKISVRR
ncbi:hypothetical protein ARMGADRAFT_1093249 [Armillaria gallica]|uniref:Uncharacterized protein n=1 Tax=Armillaria gallica TaxID=47427 RepID=A0A2H3CLS6_ARMGA|nr:hypothetical protein ARMGADRAFT_1093249 [Armillaria gallica]